MSNKPQKIYTMSATTAAEVREVVRIVRGKGTSIGTAKTTGTGRGIVGRWAKLTSASAGPFSHNRKVYLGDIYTAPGAADSIASGVQIINTWENENTASLQAGYALVTSSPACGDIIGTEALPLAQWYQILDVIVLDDEKYAVISWRNDPTFEEP